jgi:hypothetical protein
MLRAVLGDLVQRLTANGSPDHLVAARTGIRSARTKCSSATKLALATAAATPHGPAEHAIRRSTGRRSTHTARRWMGQRACGSPPNPAEEFPKAPVVAGRYLWRLWGSEQLDDVVGEFRRVVLVVSRDAERLEYVDRFLVHLALVICLRPSQQHLDRHILI